MINVTEVRPGNYFVDEGNLYRVIDILLNKTAMRKMVAKIKVQNLRTGAITEIARNSGYQVEEARIDKSQMQYLYDAGETLCFMNPESYEQIELPKGRLENEIPYLTANGVVTILSYEDEILGVQLPAKVALEVVECEPGVRGDTISNGGSKEAVPLFINQGDKISVDTATGKYDGRA